MITVHTEKSYWCFHYKYKGNNIDVFLPKENMESAMSQATWFIHDAICGLDAST